MSLKIDLYFEYSMVVTESPIIPNSLPPVPQPVWNGIFRVDPRTIRIPRPPTPFAPPDREFNPPVVIPPPVPPQEEDN